MLFKNRNQIIDNGQTLELKRVRENILDILSSALEAVDPFNAVKSRFGEKCITINKDIFDISRYKNIYLIGFGKASVGMVNAVCDSVEIKKGAVITNDSENKVKYGQISTIVGSHPIPDRNSILGAEKIFAIIDECEKEDLLIVLISGGGSALFCKPRSNLKDLQTTTNLLLKSGANINEINAIRKHLSYVKGGQLVKSVKCTLVSLIISDIVGDPMEFIASGPTYPDSTTYKDSQNILKKYQLWEKIPESIRLIIKDGIRGNIPETPKKNDPAFNKVYNYIVANNEIACKAAICKAKELGYNAMLLTTSLTGEAKDVGKYLIDKTRNYETDKENIVFVLGGETTVTIKGCGIGGRNQEMVLASVEELVDTDIVFTSFATDGIDGESNAAGAIADGFTLKKARKNNLNPRIFLEENNSYEFFKHLGDLFITNPTGTNVMDVVIIVKNK